MNNTIALVQQSPVGVLFISGRYLIVNDERGEDPSLWSFPSCYSGQLDTFKKDLTECIVKNLGLTIHVLDLLATYTVRCENNEYKRWVYWLSSQGSTKIYPKEGISFKWSTLEDLLRTPVACIDTPLIQILEDLSFA